MRRNLLLLLALIVMAGQAQGELRPCSQDVETTRDLKQALKDLGSRGYDVVQIPLFSLDGKHKVGALLVENDQRLSAIEAYLCGTTSGYFYFNGDLRSWVPSGEYQFKQVSLTDSLTIYNGETMSSLMTYFERLEKNAQGSRAKIRAYLTMVDTADEQRASLYEFSLWVPVNSKSNRTPR